MDKPTINVLYEGAHWSCTLAAAVGTAAVAVVMQQWHSLRAFSVVITQLNFDCTIDAFFFLEHQHTAAAIPIDASLEHLQSYVQHAVHTQQPESRVVAKAVVA
jgi:hypothetical protein